MKFFHSVTTKEEAKKLYKKLAFNNHPDRGGDTATMQQINAEYDKLNEMFAKGKVFGSSEKSETADFDHAAASETYRNIIENLINFDGLDIEIIGTWVWVTGNTYAAKDKLKEMGFKWANQKKAWYWHEGDYKKTSKKSYSMDEIKLMHDVRTVKKQAKPAIA